MEEYWGVEVQHKISWSDDLHTLLSTLANERGTRQNKIDENSACSDFKFGTFNDALAFVKDLKDFYGDSIGKVGESVLYKG